MEDVCDPVYTFKHGTQSKSMALSAHHPEPLSNQYVSTQQRPAVFSHTHSTYIDPKEWDGGRCLVLSTWVVFASVVGVIVYWSLTAEWGISSECGQHCQDGILKQLLVVCFSLQQD